MNLDLSKEKSLLVGNAATPFHKDTLNFFDRLSQRLIHESLGKPDMADALALGYWLRRSNISKILQEANLKQKLQPPSDNAV